MIPKELTIDGRRYVLADEPTCKPVPKSRGEEVAAKMVNQEGKLFVIRGVCGEIFCVGLIPDPYVVISGNYVESARKLVAAAIDAEIQREREEIAKAVERMDKSTHPADAAAAVRARESGAKCVICGGKMTKHPSGMCDRCYSEIA